MRLVGEDAPNSMYLCDIFQKQQIEVGRPIHFRKEISERYPNRGTCIPDNDPETLILLATK